MLKLFLGFILLLGPVAIADTGYILDITTHECSEIPGKLSMTEFGHYLEKKDRSCKFARMTVKGALLVQCDNDLPAALAPSKSICMQVLAAVENQKGE